MSADQVSTLEWQLQHTKGVVRTLRMDNSKLNVDLEAKSSDLRACEGALHQTHETVTSLRAENIQITHQLADAREALRDTTGQLTRLADQKCRLEAIVSSREDALTDMSIQLVDANTTLAEVGEVSKSSFLRLHKMADVAETWKTRAIVAEVRLSKVRTAVAVFAGLSLLAGGACYFLYRRGYFDNMLRKKATHQEAAPDAPFAAPVVECPSDAAKTAEEEEEDESLREYEYVQVK